MSLTLNSTEIYWNEIGKGDLPLHLGKSVLQWEKEVHPSDAQTEVLLQWGKSNDTTVRHRSTTPVREINATPVRDSNAESSEGDEDANDEL